MPESQTPTPTLETTPETTPTAAYVEQPAGRYRSSPLTRGPWHPDHQHAGPPIALTCRAIEQAAQAHGLTHVARITANLLRPVPIGELRVEVSNDYVGRNAGHFSARLLSADKELGRFTALVQRENPLALPDDLPGHPLPTMSPGPDDAFGVAMPFAGQRLGYADLVETRAAHGTMFRGPCAIWFRLRYPLLEGESPSPYQRVAVAADSGNGISAILDMSRFSFVNSDLSVHLLRRPVGDWVCLESRTHLSPDGCGLAESALYDKTGLIGRSMQSLMVRPQ
jgi:hypothetical protein